MYNGRCIRARVASVDDASDARSNLDLAPLGKSIFIQKHPYTGLTSNSVSAINVYKGYEAVIEIHMVQSSIVLSFHALTVFI
jgi:hypothetical protein